MFLSNFCLEVEALSIAFDAEVQGRSFGDEVEEWLSLFLGYAYLLTRDLHLCALVGFEPFIVRFV